MRDIILRLEQFDAGISPGGNYRASEMILKPLLELMAWMNVVQLQTNPSIKPLYEYVQRGLVTYQREPPGIELFCGIKEVLRQGGGDCDDLCAWRVAELRMRGSQPYYPNGEQATFRIMKFPPGKDNSGLLYHIQVRRAPTPEHPDPKDPFLIEDPSFLAGMPMGG